MLHLLLIYLVLTNPFIRFTASDTHLYIVTRISTYRVREGELMKYEALKTFKLFRYGN